MSPLHYRDMIIRASQAGDMRRIDQLAAQLAQAEEARRLLQALTHCPACVASTTAHLVLSAPPPAPVRVEVPVMGAVHRRGAGAPGLRVRQVTFDGDGRRDRTGVGAGLVTWAGI